jgi:uncharacterized protein (TIGR00255 family)
MALSMTGFSFKEADTQQGILLLEFRSLNNRYLELQVKLDESLRTFEPMIRDVISSEIKRGKVDCRIYFKLKSNALDVKNVDLVKLKQLANSVSEIGKHFPHVQPINPLDILKTSEIMHDQSLDINLLEQDLKKNLKEALIEIQASKAREGEKLQKILLDKLKEIEILVGEAKKILPTLIKEHQSKIENKFKEALIAIDEDRLKQEFLIFIQKMDIDEELNRITSHIDEVRRLLKIDGQIGKKLDFMMQELNREANTLGSKSISPKTSQISVDLKVLIEQMREQIQNIE